MDPLFPELPEDLSGLSDEDLANLKQEHEVAADLIDKEDESFTKDLSADEILAEYERGVEQIEAITAEQAARVTAQEEYLQKKADLAARRKGEAAAETEGEGDRQIQSLIRAAEGEEQAGARCGDRDRGRGRGEEEEVEVEEKEVAVAAAATPVPPASPATHPVRQSAWRAAQAAVPR